MYSVINICCEQEDTTKKLGKNRLSKKVLIECVESALVLVKSLSKLTLNWKKNYNMTDIFQSRNICNIKNRYIQDV